MIISEAWAKASWLYWEQVQSIWHPTWEISSQTCKSKQGLPGLNSCHSLEMLSKSHGSCVILRELILNWWKWEVGKPQYSNRHVMYTDDKNLLWLIERWQMQHVSHTRTVNCHSISLENAPDAATIATEQPHECNADPTTGRAFNQGTYNQPCRLLALIKKKYLGLCFKRVEHLKFIAGVENKSPLSPAFSY